MELGLTALAAQLFLLYILSKIIIYIDFQYKRSQADDYIAVNVYIGKNIVLYSLKVPVVDIVKHNELPWLDTKIATKHGVTDTNIEREQRFMKNSVNLYLKNPRRFWRLLKSVKRYAKLYRKFMCRLVNSLTCESLCWRTQYGSDDAAMTGLMGGALWSIKGMMVTVLKRRFDFIRPPDIAITPVFGRSCLDVEFQCIFSFSLGKVINATTIFLNNSGKGAATGGRTSDSRTNEDSHGKHKRHG